MVLTHYRGSISDKGMDFPFYVSLFIAYQERVPLGSKNGHEIDNSSAGGWECVVIRLHCPRALVTVVVNETQRQQYL